MPHKQAALAIADDMTERARAIRSTNTSVFRDGQIVADIVAEPRITSFLTSAEECRLKVVGGLGMLLYQAPSGFEEWFDVCPFIEKDVWEVMLTLWIGGPKSTVAAAQPLWANSSNDRIRPPRLQRRI